uniref:C2H2-type domain-containing protein n=1 Tax=viral metagenome TaxID=1070528 RepID=A0A6C0KGV5_9ZZZZ
MEIKKLQKVAKKYICNICYYSTSNLNNYNKHLLTQKHRNNDLEINGNFGNEKVAKFNICNICNKSYDTKSGLWKHIKKCKKEDDNNIFLNTNNNVEKLTEILLSHQDMITNQKDMITNQQDMITNQQEQIKEFHDTLKTMMTSNEKREEIFFELAKKPSIMGNNNNINYHVYLNEHCANTIDFPDFLNNINITMDDLFYSKNNGYPKAISNIFQKNLSILDKTERPIYCSDKKRMNFYVKDGKWKKDNEYKKILESIWKVTHKQIKYMDEWRKANPNWRENEEKDLEFMNIVRNIMGGSTDEEQIKNNNKIIKDLANNNDIKELFND